MRRAITTPALVGLALAGLLVGLAWTYRGLATADLTNWDDDRFLAYNPLFHDGGWSYIEAAFTRVQFEAYQPLHLISYLPDRYLWPGWPPGFHLLDLGLFAADVIVLWRVIRRHTSDLAALAALAVFALHPLCVEPVAWVTERKDLVMLLLVILALRREDRRTGARPDPAALALYLCALVTKSSSVCFPVILFAWLRWVAGRPPREALGRSACHAAAALAVSLAVFLIWSIHGMIPDRGLADRLVGAATTVASYAGHVVWPVDLAPVYPTEPAHPAAAAVLCVLAGLAIAVAWRRLPARARFAAVAAAGALLPVSNLVPMSLGMADRYAFVMLAVLVLPLAAALDWLAARAAAARAAVAAVVVLVAAAEATASSQLVATWRSSRELWAHAVAAQPRAFLAHVKYGETLGDLQRWPEAAAQLAIAQQLNPRSLVPLEQLFQLDAERAELDGLVPRGTTARWLDQLEAATADRDAYRRLAGEVDATACRPCGNAVVALGLAAWPEPDAALLAAARSALDRGAGDRARVYLARVRDRTLAELGELERRVHAAAPVPPAPPPPRSP